MISWQVQLEGDIGDLQFLAGKASTGSRKVLRDGQNQTYLYESDSFHECHTSEEVEHLAEQELAVLSGILRLEHNAQNGLKLGAIYALNADGGRNIFVKLRESFQVRNQAGNVTVVVIDAEGNASTPPASLPRAEVLLKLSAEDSAVAKALRLLSVADAKEWGGGTEFTKLSRALSGERMSSMN